MWVKNSLQTNKVPPPIANKNFSLKRYLNYIPLKQSEWAKLLEKREVQKNPDTLYKES